MNRRHFIQKSALGLAGLGFSGRIIASPLRTPASKTLTILHTNDQHSRIDPFDAGSPRYANQGGFARRATMIENIRKTNPSLLLLDSGDIFQGTPYFNYYGGSLEFKLMSMMGYDAATMGNHDFDNELQGFLDVLPNAKFPFITSNYDFTNTILEGKTLANKIFVRDGIRVGIFGLGIELEGLVGKKQFQETKYLDPIEIAQEQTAILKQKKCDFIICLSHLGYEYRDEATKISDTVLASKTSGIDLILGGHTHTFLPAPVWAKNKEDKNVLINQVGFAGLMLGRLDFTFGRDKKIQEIAWTNQMIDETIQA